MYDSIGAIDEFTVRKTSLTLFLITVSHENLLAYLFGGESGRRPFQSSKGFHLEGWWFGSYDTTYSVQYCTVQ
jgi:hypothetical protein